MPKTSRWIAVGSWLCVVALLGCTIEIPNEAAKAKKNKKTNAKTQQVADAKDAKKVNVRSKPNKDDGEIEIKIPDPTRRNQPGSNSEFIGGGSRSTGGSTFVASAGSSLSKVSELVKETVDLGPTLVVWVLDVSDSAFNTSRSITSEIVSMHERIAPPPAANSPAGSTKTLLSAVISFSTSPKFVLEEPTSDRAKIKELLDGLKEEPDGTEATFAAVKLGLDKFASYRTRTPQYQVMFVIVTDEAGDDGAVIDGMLPTLSKYSIPVFCIGRSAPFGRKEAAMSSSRFGMDNTKKTSGNANHGPESRDIEFVPLAFNENSGFGGGGGDYYDSGLGPYNLERICRKSGGAFLASSFGGGGSSRIDPNVMQKYLPEYVSEAEYQALIDSSPARKAILEAAKLRMPKGLSNPQTSFGKGGNDAAFANALNVAQRPAAALEADINRVYDVLVKGEGDRQKITSPRWQATYDLALGQISALKANVEGYNQMVATLKTKNTFTKETSSVWMLVPDDRIASNSQLDKLAEKSKTYLTRVAKDHAGTPWGVIAERELKKQIGWKLEER